MSEGHPEEIPLEEIPESGLEKLFSTLDEKANPGVLHEVADLAPVPPPSFGTLAGPDAGEGPAASVWEQTEAEGSPPPVPEEPQAAAPDPATEPYRPPTPDPGPGIDWSSGDPGVQERLERLRSPEPESINIAAAIGADLDPEPSNPFQRVLGRVRGRSMAEAPAQMDPPSEFARLLTPLSGSEVALLEKEVQADEVIFVRMERVRADASLRQRLGLLIGTLTVILFLLSVGESYVIDILPEARIPAWVPADDMAQQIAGGTLFALGLILPFLCVFVFAEATRLLLWALGDRSLWLAAAGALSGLAGILAMSFTIRGEIPAAVMVLLVYLFLSELERRLRPGRGG